MISLKAPAILNFTLTPALFAKSKKLSNFASQLTLDEQTSIQATIPQFSCPIFSLGKDWIKAPFQANISNSSPIPFSLNVDLSPPTIGSRLNKKRIFITNLKLGASSTLLEEKVAFTCFSNLNSESQSGSIALDGNIFQPLTKNRQGTLNLNGIDLPVDLIGTLTSSSYPLDTLLGPNYKFPRLFRN